MTPKERAVKLDSQDRPVEAARAYEEAIVRSDADLETYLNLAALYFVCQDGWYSAHHDLPIAFLTAAWDRFYEVLDEAEARFGKSSEIDFWRHYFGFIVLGEEPSLDLAERTARSGSSLVPYFYLFMLTDAGGFRQEAQNLYEMVRDGATAKERYIRSILKNRTDLKGIKAVEGVDEEIAGT